MEKILADTDILVAIITMGGVVFSVIGSIIATNLTNNAQLEQQRIDSIREMKRTYYNQLLEAYTEKLMYVNKPDSVEKIEAEMRFIKEVNRVPLYASQEMVEFMEKMKDPKIAKGTNPGEFYLVMRKDLASSDFENFDTSLQLSISIPNKVIVISGNGNKKIQ